MAEREDTRTPASEAERIAALNGYDVLDTPPEPDIDDIARLSAQICGTPVALVTLIDGRRQFFKARYGFDSVESDLETGFCPLVVQRGEPVTIPDTLADRRHASNVATVKGGIRFYAGVPLEDRAGHVLGTLCVLDRKPRVLDDNQHAALSALARQVMTQLELRSALRRERESDVRHRLTLDSATEYGIVGLTLEGMVRDWNTGAGRILRMPAVRALGCRLDDLVHIDGDADWLARDLRLTLAEGRASIENEAHLADGTTFWAHLTTTPMRDAKGNVSGFVVVLLDRTVEKRRERSLDLLARSAADLLVADKPDVVLQAILVESAPLIGFEHAYAHRIAPDGQHLQLAASVGLSDEERAFFANAPFDATTCAGVVDTRQRLVINDLQASDDPRCTPVRTLGLTAYAAFPVMIGDRLYGVLTFGSTRLRRFDEEALTFFATLTRYLSMSRELEAGQRAAQLFAGTLERRVEERTAALQETEAALRQSQKMEAVGQLTGGVAHDFNNLLTIIRSSVDFLRRPDLPEARKSRYLDAVSDTVDRAAKLTGQLLAFARRQALKPEVFDVDEKVRAIADMLDSVTGSRIRIVLAMPEEPCFVRADLSQFETALVNMAINARDAMDGEGTLSLRLACSSGLPSIRGHAASRSRFAAVSLTDTGLGIPPDDIGRIFEPFFTTKEVGKGTGLGLSQVFGFAKQSGGDVDVISEPGRGSTFTLYLPEVEIEAREPRDLFEDEGAPVGSGQHILVVEDNVDVGRFCTQILEDLGYRTAWAANAEEALARLGEPDDGFDAVFSDVVMPGMGGLALAEELRRRMPEMPVVLASGYSHVLAQDDAHGFELLHKPYSAEQLSKVLRRVTSRRAGAFKSARP